MTKSFNFTKTALDKLPKAPPGTRVTYYDGGGRDSVHGLTLRVTESGAKSFGLRHRINGKRIRHTIGRFPEMTVAIARAQAKDVMGQMVRGINPSEEKRKARQVKPEDITLREAWENYQADKPGLREGTVKSYTAALRPVLGDWMDKRLFDIKPRDVLARHNRYPSKSQAKQAMRVLSAIYNAHIRIHELDKANPVTTALPGTGKGGEGLNFKKRNRNIIEHLPLWFDAVDKLPEVGKRASWRGDVAKDLFYFQLFTGLRSKSECASLEWNQVDLNKATITYQVTKTNYEDDAPIVTPLNQQALEILKSRPQEGRYVFASGEGYLSYYQTYQAHVRHETGSEWNPQDTRRTFMSVGESIAVPPLSLKRLVNHKSQEHDVTAGYVVSSLEDLRKQSQRIAWEILRRAGRGEKAEVVPFRG
tara:strand:+ start:456 stop:1712 length:1257 start_codon:yes stop_codon:yes gene_type:complete